MIAMLLLAAADVVPDDIGDDYLETVRRGGLRAARTGRLDDESQLEELCRSHGSSTEDAFRDALGGLDLDEVLKEGP